VPLDFAFECDPTIFHNCFYLIPGEWQITFDCFDSITGNFRIRSAMDDGQTHLNVVGNTDHASDALYMLLGPAPLPKATDESGQHHGTILHRDGDVGRVNIRI